MHLKGNFEPASLASILQLLSNDERTGILQLTNGENEVKMFVKNGDVISATGSNKESRLGYLLRSKGMISVKDLAYCLAVSKEKKQALGSVLVKRGFISVQTLKKTIHRQAEEVIYNLFLWKTGYFEYNDTNNVPKGALVTKIDIMNIIMEATRRIDEMAVFAKHIPSDKLVFRVSDKALSKQKMDFKPHEQRFFSLIDGTRTVRQLVKISGYDDFTVYNILNSFISTGLVERNEKAHVLERKTGSDYSEIVVVYNEIFQVIRENLEAELEKWISAIFDDANPEPEPEQVEIIKRIHETALRKWTRNIVENCKPQNFPQQKSLFKAYHLDNTVEANVLVITEALKTVKEFERGRAFLVKSFNQFINNLLDTIVMSFGIKTTRKMLVAINNALIHINEKQSQFPEKRKIIKAMMDILILMAQQSKIEGDAAKNRTGIFAVFGDK
jgi:predicted transcriptional regulator